MEAKNGMIGKIVRSAAGRDKDRFLVITAVDGDFAMIADGKTRKLSAPKKKRLKHLRFTNNTVDMQDITDKKLRRLLGEFAGEVPPDKQTTLDP